MMITAAVVLAGACVWAALGYLEYVVEGLRRRIEELEKHEL
jgi:hypothetical protein